MKRLKNTILEQAHRQFESYQNATAFNGCYTVHCGTAGTLQNAEAGTENEDHKYHINTNYRTAEK